MVGLSTLKMRMVQVVLFFSLSSVKPFVTITPLQQQCHKTFFTPSSSSSSSSSSFRLRLDKASGTDGAEDEGGPGIISEKMHQPSNHHDRNLILSRLFACVPLSRRKLFGRAATVGVSTLAIVATTSTATTADAATTEAAVSAEPLATTPALLNSPSLNWPLGKVAFSLLPLAGTYTPRLTVEETIIPGTMWTHDQVQGVVNVNVPVRQTVIKLSPSAGGGLLVHNPVAPTPQLLDMMSELEAEHGPVRHIILGTVALEHKATFGPFASRFPRATVWVQPGQWSFPLGLPIEFLGVTQRGPRLREIPDSRTGEVSRAFRYYNKDAPEWTADLDYETLGPLRFKSVGGFSETAFFHRATKTLIVTDAVVSVTPDPPPIIAADPRAMLFHARDNVSEVVADTPAVRRKGWRRMVQFGLVFFPSQIDTVVPIGEAIEEARRIDPSMKPLGQGAVPLSLYPWTWTPNDADQRNFDAISRDGKIFCPPILTKLILDREPDATLDWVDRITSRFDFDRIVPGHLNNNVRTNPREFREAFEVLASDPKSGKIRSQRPLAEDLALLQKASDLLTNYGVVDVSKVCDGEPARVEGRFASKSPSLSRR